MRGDFRKGLLHGVSVWVLLGLSLLPARLSVAMRVRGGSSFERVTRALAGTVLDGSRVSWLFAAVLALCCTLALVVSRGKTRFAGWMTLTATAVIGVALGLITLTEQEVKAERGAFPTLVEMLEAGGQSSFMEGALGFVRYQRIVVPVAVCAVAFLVVALLTGRALSRGSSKSHRGWWSGVVTALLVSVPLWSVGAAALAASSPRLAPAGLGDPLQALMDTSVDWAKGLPPARPAQVLAGMKVTDDEARLGAQRLGWPPAPHRRPLLETGAPADDVLKRLRELSEVLFAGEGPPVVVVQFSLESLRSDDLHCLNPHAPASLSPFLDGLSRRDGAAGVLISRKMYQAGVRTAQGLAATVCGLGTLPWNVSVIRDFDGELTVPLRCAPDVLHSAGYEGSFFYGSDASYDRMAPFLSAHGIGTVISEEAFPASAPRGAWGGVTDFALFDDVVKRLSATNSRQFSLVMSLSNHSPYTVPADLPPHVAHRAAAALQLPDTPHRATLDDVKRLTTLSYTDAALERFFAALDSTGLASRTLVVLVADHSTGEDYVWGDESFDHETDEAKARVPFFIVVPGAFMARLGSPARAALDDVQKELDAHLLSQNDVPAVVLSLLSAEPGLRGLASDERWHTLGGQRTSPYFRAGGEPGAALVGINGVDELYVLDEHGARLGPYEDATFLRTAGDAQRVTPRLIPAAQALVALSRQRP